MARENGFNVLVLAQHLDDFAESFYMSFARNGLLRTMKACYEEGKDHIRVIRPFCFLRETETKKFVIEAKLPVISENCPACFAGPQERERIKRLLDHEESVVPNLFDSLRKCLLPLMSARVVDVLQLETKALRDAYEADVGAKKKAKERDDDDAYN